MDQEGSTVRRRNGRGSHHSKDRREAIGSDHTGLLVTLRLNQVEVEGTRALMEKVKGGKGVPPVCAPRASEHFDWKKGARARVGDGGFCGGECQSSLAEFGAFRCRGHSEGTRGGHRRERAPAPNPGQTGEALRRSLPSSTKEGGTDMDVLIHLPVMLGEVAGHSRRMS